MSRIETIIDLAQKLADEVPKFYVSLGPGKKEGDGRTNTFLDKLNARCEKEFDRDYSQKRICGENGFRVDFYVPEEDTILEVAFLVKNSPSEFERDIFKALLAKDAGNSVRKLVVLSKPGGEAHQGAPAPQAIREWVKRVHGIEVVVRDLVEKA